jgi:hypothetical protein
MTANNKIQNAGCKLRNIGVPPLARKQCLPLMALMIFCLCSSAAYADSGEAVNKVREGLAQFRGGDFKLAAEAFSAADEALPNELKIAFDRGCAYAAGGDFDKAVEQFQKAAAASDHKLAALANYNLGGVAVARAKEKLGDKPEEAEGDARTAALEFAMQAAKHYRDCLTMDADNSDARYNLETLRMWIKNIQDVWQKRDRQKRRDAMNLLQYLQWIEGEQRTLVQTEKELGTLSPSPRQREAIRAVENAQRDLAEEIQPLKDKISATLTAPQQQPGANQASSPTADVQKAMQLLDGLADQAHDSMNKAADSLAAGIMPDAAASQSHAIETIDQIFMAVAPYTNLVQRGIERQQELVDQSPATEKEKTDEQNAAEKKAGQSVTGQQPAQTPQHQPQSQATASKPSFDGEDAAWRQRFVARYGQILGAKAKRELEQLEAAAQAKPEPPQSATSTAPGTAQTPEKAQASDEQLKAEEARKDLKEALQLGIQSAPKVENLAEYAAQLLDENNPAEALPKQQEALKLLKEMLPKQQDQDKKDQDKKDQDKKDQDKKDQDKKDQDKKDQDKKDQEKKDQQKQDQNKKDKDKKDQKQQDQQKEQEKKDQGQSDKDKQDQQKKADKNQQQKQDQQSKRDLNKQQAEAVLQQARERQDQHRELQKRLEGLLYRPEKVDKDW